MRPTASVVEKNSVLYAFASPQVLNNRNPSWTDLYRANATRPARIAPALMTLAAAPPSKSEAVGDGPEPLVMVLLGALVTLLEVPATRVKFAQVRRVVLARWTTKERLPKKEAGPLTVER